MSDAVAAVAAGRFDASNSSVVARLRRAARTHRVYMTTEVTGRQWRAMKRNLPEGWEAVRLNEFVIAWDGQRMEPRGVKAHWSWVTRGFFNRGRIRIRGKVGEIRLADRGGLDPDGCYYSVLHLPAHIQRGSHYTVDPTMQDEVAAHKEALAAVGRRAQRRKTKHPERRQCVTGDVNVDLFDPVWRGFLRSEIGLTGAFRHDNLPSRGDMGRRLITGAWTHGFEKTSATVTLTPEAEGGLDHRMVLVQG